MKEVMIRIKGKQVSKDSGEDEMEFMTEGKLYRRKGTVYLLYEETELSGVPGCKTRLRLRDGEIQMKRIGEGAGIGNEILFEQGKRYTGYYDTPFGPIPIEVLTNYVNSSITEDGSGDIDIDYEISLKGLMEGRNTLNITLM
ncbi:MAG: DUF1934 domain-containing protein [Firmicutes bacterium]|nr:DUF1934 domain-containing protein [Bacillota bacterium]